MHLFIQLNEVAIANLLIERSAEAHAGYLSNRHEGKHELAVVWQPEWIYISIAYMYNVRGCGLFLR